MKTKHELRSYFSIYAHVYLKRTNNILSIVHSIVFYPRHYIVLCNVIYKIVACIFWLRYSVLSAQVMQHRMPSQQTCTFQVQVAGIH